jgi:hypothetical protein
VSAAISVLLLLDPAVGVMVELDSLVSAVNAPVEIAEGGPSKLARPGTAVLDALVLVI